MISPFPGMNPYLEHPDRWSTVHNRLIVALADVLTPQLLPKYQVDIEKRIYEVLGANSLLVGRADVSVQQPRTNQEGTMQVAVTPLPQKPVQVTVPMLEEVREAYLEVKDVATQAVVTVVEILSPTNKRGDGRQKYEKKRQQIFNSRTHLVEIDLLREGEPLPLVETISKTHYRILISRAEYRPSADLYQFNLQDPIPEFTLPLKAQDDEPVINLRELLDQVYERSGYNYFIDYSTLPVPPLSSTEQQWVETYLQQQGLH